MKIKQIISEIISLKLQLNVEIRATLKLWLNKSSSKPLYNALRGGSLEFSKKDFSKCSQLSSL